MRPWFRLPTVPGLLPLLVLVAAFPWGAEAQDGAGAGPLPFAAPLSVRLDGGGVRVLGSREVLRLELSRPLESGEGRLAVLLGDTDITALTGMEGTTGLVYRPLVEGLPRGESEVRVFLVRGEDARWEEVARLPIQVQVAPGVDRAGFDPRLSVTGGAPLASGLFPVVVGGTPDPDRDLTGQLDLEAELVGGTTTVALEANLQGVNRRENALRFREMQGEAPLLDLGRWGARVEGPGVTLEMGQVSTGNHPDLIRSFSARGVRLRAAPVQGVDLAVAALQGSGTVGWRPVLGLGDAGHRVLTGQVGVELVPGRTGGLRLEGVVMDGSRLPIASFGRGEIRDTESSSGAGFRVVGSTPGQRLRGEVTLARARYENPADASVAPEVAALATPEVARSAVRGDVALVLLERVELPAGLRGSLQAGYRWGRVDPLFRTIGTFVRPDVEERIWELQGSVGPMMVRATMDRSVDNLDRIPTILRTRTARNALNVNLPLASLPGVAGRRAAPVLPSVTYQFNQTHQLGETLPVDGGFDPTHVPDQMNDVHNLSLAWQTRRVRLGLRGGYSLQDNRQPGREGDDFRNVTTAVALGVSPTTWLDLGADLSLEEATNEGQARTDRTTGLNLSLTARPGWDTGLRISFAPNRVRDAEGLRERSSDNLSAELSKRFRLGGGGSPGSGSAFLRFDRRTSAQVDLPLGVDDATRVWNLTSGLTLSLF